MMILQFRTPHPHQPYKAEQRVVPEEHGKGKGVHLRI